MCIISIGGGEDKRGVLPADHRPQLWDGAARGRGRPINTLQVTVWLWAAFQDLVINFIFVSQ